MTPDQIAQAQAALAVYRAYWSLVDQAIANPSADWSAQIAQYATGPEYDSFLKALSQASARGQRATGTTGISPRVTKVETALVTVADCVDKTNTDYLAADGTSIKAPDAPGSYFRHPSTVQIGQLQDGRWAVMGSTDDWTQTC